MRCPSTSRARASVREQGALARAVTSGALLLALGTPLLAPLTGCGGDDRYDGTATLTVSIYRSLGPPETETRETAMSVNVRRDMGGETVTLYLGDGAPCALTPDSPPGEALSFASAFGCVFQTSAGEGLGTLSEGKGSIVEEQSLSLDLTFSLEAASATTPELSGTLVLAFDGEACPSD